MFQQQQKKARKGFHPAQLFHGEHLRLRLSLSVTSVIVIVLTHSHRAAFHQICCLVNIPKDYQIMF